MTSECCHGVESMTCECCHGVENTTSECCHEVERRPVNVVMGWKA